jgi:hypothetical protein
MPRTWRPGSGANLGAVGLVADGLRQVNAPLLAMAHAAINADAILLGSANLSHRQMNIANFLFARLPSPHE